MKQDTLNNTIGSTLFCFPKSKQVICFQKQCIVKIAKNKGCLYYGKQNFESNLSNPYTLINFIFSFKYVQQNAYR
jgi:hypothetical protein